MAGEGHAPAATQLADMQGEDDEALHPDSHSARYPLPAGQLEHEALCTRPAHVYGQSNIITPGDRDGYFCNFLDFWQLSATILGVNRISLLFRLYLGAVGR